MANYPKNMTLEKRYPWFGIKCALKWVRNPVSEKGATQVARVKMAFAGPQVLDDLKQMKAHPVGSKLLSEKPDFGAAMDVANLATMPEGSFGHELFKVYGQEDTIPGYLLAGLAYRDGFFDSIDMSEDARWYLERTFFDHDASHVISGYGTDLAGEALNIFFAMGYQSAMPRWLAFAQPFGWGPMILSPKVGKRKWFKLLGQAFDRGRAAREHFAPHSIPYEELLPKQVAEVRTFLGITPLLGGFDTSDWLEGNAYAEAAVDGFGEKLKKDPSEVKLAQAAVEAGLPWRDLMRAGDSAREKLMQVVRQGGTLDEMKAALN